MAENYRAFYSRAFLFQTGDPIVRHAVRGFGELPPFYAPFLLLGALVALLRRDRASKLLLLWAALYPIGPSLMNEIPSATRGFIGVPILCLLTGVGFAAGLRVLGWIGHWRPVALGLQTVAVVVAAASRAPGSKAPSIRSTPLPPMADSSTDTAIRFTTWRVNARSTTCSC